MASFADRAREGITAAPASFGISVNARQHGETQIVIDAAREVRGPTEAATLVAQPSDARETVASVRALGRDGKTVQPMQHTPLDKAVVGWLVIRWINFGINGFNLYLAARSLLSAWKLGWVSRETYYRRRRICDQCEHRYDDPDSERQFCAYAGGCGCGHRRAAALEVKLNLSNWGCPAGRFGKGSNVKQPQRGCKKECECNGG